MGKQARRQRALCSRSQRVSGMRKRVQGAAPPIGGSLCPLPVRGSGREPLPWPGGGVLPAASPLRSGRRSCGETQLRASERLPRGREAPADAKGPKHEAGEHVPRPFPAQVRFGLFWGQQTVRSRPVLEWCLCGQRAPRSSVRNRRRSTR